MTNRICSTACTLAALLAFSLPLYAGKPGQPGQAHRDTLHPASALRLPEYRADIEAQVIAGINGNLSGITFNPDNGHFWVVVNRPPQLLELDANLEPLRRIRLKNFTDTEAVAYAGNHQLLIADEREQSVLLAAITPDTLRLDKRTLPRFTLRPTQIDNKGWEGLAINPGNGDIFAGRERDPVQLLVLKGGLAAGKGLKVETTGTVALDKLALADLSGLHFDPRSGHLLVLSDASRRLAEIDYQGRPLSVLRLTAGAGGLSHSIGQPEGVTLDSENTLYIVSEPNLLYRFRPARSTHQ